MREDLSVFLADFAETVTLTNGKTFKAVRSADFVEVGDSGAGVESSAPTFLARTADVVGVAFGTVVELDNVQYVVRGVQPDGTGMTALRLENT